MSVMDSESSSGTYEVTSSDKKHTVEADRWDYSARDELQFWKDGKVVAVFRWWDSIKAKTD